MYNFICGINIYIPHSSLKRLLPSCKVSTFRLTKILCEVLQFCVNLVSTKTTTNKVKTVNGAVAYGGHGSSLEYQHGVFLEAWQFKANEYMAALYYVL